LSTATYAKKQTNKLTVLLACFVMVLAGTAANVVAAGKIEPAGSRVVSGAIAGVVKDFVSNDVIAGATVNVYNQTYALMGTDTTDGSGAYAVTALIDGTYTVNFTHLDYNMMSMGAVTVSGGLTTTLDVALNPLPSTISGQVMDTTHFEPIMFATVTLYEDGTKQQNTMTDMNGNFSFTTLARSVELSASMTGYIQYSSGTEPIGVHEDLSDQLIFLSRTSISLSGQITGMGPVSGAKVVLMGDDYAEAITNETGWYNFNVVWGQYTMVITKDGFFFYSEQVYFTWMPTQTMSVDIKETPTPSAEAFGYVKDKVTEMPISGAMVCLVDNDLGGQLCAMTGMDGYFHFMVYPAYFELQISAPGYKGHSSFVSIIKGDNKNLGDILLTVLPVMDKTLSGIITSGATPVSKATVTIFDGEVSVNSGMSDPSGDYAVMTYAGTFTVKVEAFGFFDKTVTGVVISADKTLDIAIVEIPMMNNTFFGYVKDTAGVPISGAMVQLVDTATGHSWYTFKDATTTGGFYSFNIYDGSFLFMVQAKGFQTDMKKLTIAANHQEDMTLSVADQEVQKTSIVFKDWSNASIMMDSHIVNDVMMLRYTIDTAYGNGDGTVTTDEVSAWLAVEQAKGPMAKDTEGMLSVDGTSFGIVDGTFAVAVHGAEGDILSAAEVLIAKSANFTTKAPIAALKNHTVKFNAAFDNKVMDNTTDLTVPAGWEARKIDAEYVSVSGTFTVTMNPPMEMTGISSEMVVLNVTGNKIPVADAGHNKTVKVNVNQTFDASASSDDFGISNYTWNFGDGTMGYKEVSVHKFTLPTGEDKHNYTVTLTVKDTAGVINSTKIWVLVDGAPPVATFVATGSVNGTADSPVANEDQEKIYFNASGSMDNVKIANYTWYFGDGKFAYGMAVNHTWVQPGTYNVTLNVTDAAGWWANHTVAVTIKDITHPIARITFNGESSIYLENKVNLTFNGSKSTDNVGVVTYTWSFGDGSAGVTGNKTKAQEAIYQYTKIGKFNVTLTVLDAATNTNTSVAITIEVKSKPKIPDLTIESIKIENAASFKMEGLGIHDGDKVKITVKVKNNGDGAISAGNPNTDFSIQFTYGTHKISMKRSLTIAAHGETTVTVYWDKAKQGKYKICADADPENRIGEVDETNNKKCSKTYDITYSWTLIGGISAGVVVVIVLAAVGWYMSKKASEERREKLRQRKKIR
jgi:PKD repeat protein